MRITLYAMSFIINMISDDRTISLEVIMIIIEVHSSTPGDKPHPPTSDTKFIFFVTP